MNSFAFAARAVCWRPKITTPFRVFFLSTLYNSLPLSFHIRIIRPLLERLPFCTLSNLIRYLFSFSLSWGRFIGALVDHGSGASTRYVMNMLIPSCNACCRNTCFCDYLCAFVYCCANVYCLEGSQFIILATTIQLPLLLPQVSRLPYSPIGLGGISRRQIRIRYCILHYSTTRLQLLVTIAVDLPSAVNSFSKPFLPGNPVFTRQRPQKANRAPCSNPGRYNQFLKLCFKCKVKGYKNNSKAVALEDPAWS
jgi:hypothetical protein